jgi:hypothetical protein
MKMSFRQLINWTVDSGVIGELRQNQIRSSPETCCAMTQCDPMSTSTLLLSVSIRRNRI